MRGASIGRGLRLALLGLTLTLLAVIVLGVAALYGARADYERALAQSHALEGAAEQLGAAGVLEQATRLRARGDFPGALARARRAFDAQARRARALAAGDPASLRLVVERQSLQDRIRDAGPAETGGAARVLGVVRPALTADAREATESLVARQEERRAAARARARDETRTAVITILGAGLLTLVAALLLVRGLVGRVRRPLDDLVGATTRLASGDLRQGVSTEGPREIRELSESFNTMATELRGAHERIEHERRKLAVTIESLGDGLAVCDPAGRVTAFNPRAAHMIPGLAVGEPLDAEGGVLPSIEDAIGGEAMIEAGGRALAVTASPLETGTGGTVWTIRDTTERVRLERMKSDFVAAASHELRSPLTSIKGFAELLGHSDDLTAKQREATDIIRASTDRLVGLVDDLLEVARIEAGRVSVVQQTIRIEPLVEETARLMAPRIEASGQRLELALSPDLPPVLADGRRVRQILDNLLANAHLYSGEGGRIEVRCEPAGDEVEIAVADDGHGMTREELEHAFDRFYRGDRAGMLVPGTGLGLWIVRSLAELQGGSVEVASEAGRGSTFTVRLPRAPAGAEIEAEPAPARPPATARSAGG
jgi:signal transduction histidine kinase/HAMP domain-containing protein